jgi:hypothetical protein
VNTTCRKTAASVLGALGALGPPLFLALPANATATSAVTSTARPALRPATAEMRLAYDTPQISPDGEHVIWRWALTNAGPGGAADVVLVNHLTPTLVVTGMSKECRAVAAAISCSYGMIKAGERRNGELDASLGDVSGTVEIHGRMTWRQGVAGLQDPGAKTSPIFP